MLDRMNSSGGNKMNSSIGGYNIVNYSKTEVGKYKAELFKYETKLATIENLGDDFIDVTFEPLPEDAKEDYYKFILNDMYELSFELAPVLKDDGLFKSFLLSQYAATIGFVKLLVDLADLITVYNTVPDKANGDYYLIGAFGRSWFTKEDASYDKTYFWKYALTHVYIEAEKTLIAHANSRKVLDGRLVAGAVLVGEMDWNISFEDFGELYNPLNA
jgi:hypothetical protein